MICIGGRCWSFLKRSCKNRCFSFWCLALKLDSKEGVADPKIMRARIILGSATPSLESSFNAKHQKLKHLFLHERFRKDQHLPPIQIIDLTKRAADVDFRTQDTSQ